MIMKIMCVALLCFLTNVSFAQTFTQDADARLANVSKAYVTSNILYDRVFPGSGLHVFTTLDTATYTTIQDAISEMYRAQLSGNPASGNPANIFLSIADSSSKIGVVDIASIFYQYHTIDPNAIENNLLTYGPDSLLYNVPNGLGGVKNPFQLNTIFMAAPIASNCNLVANTLQINWGQNRYTNQANSIAYLQVDAGDGTGYHTLYPGQNFSANYDGSGNKVWHIKGYLSGGAVYSCYAYIYINVANGPILYGRRPDASLTPDNFEHQDWIVADIGFPDEGSVINRHGTAKLSIYYKDATRDLPENQRKITKPIFISDGFDPLGDRDALKFAEQLLYDKTDPNNPLSGKSFISDLNELGYDVIICDYKPLPTTLRNTFNPNGLNLVEAKITGADYIQRNAYAFVKAIQWANGQLQSAGSNEQIVIIGPSMGGLITRYALRWMELNNLSHNCRLWISFDSPHQGANIPLSGQALIAYGANYLEISSAKDQKEKRLDNPAARQMLVSHYTDLRTQNSIFNNAGKNSLKISFYNEINNLGWPQNCRKVSIVNGNLSGIRSSVPGKEYFSMTAYSTVKVLFFFKVKVAKIQCWIRPDAGVAQRIFYGWRIPYAGIIVNETGDSRNSIDAAPGSYFGLPEALRQSVLQSSKRYNDLLTIYNGFLLWPLGYFPSVGAATKNQVIEIGTFDPADCFIPSKSALAVDGNWNENLSTQNVSTGCGNGRSPFNNYYAPAISERHTYLSVGTVNFCKRELNNEIYQEVNTSNYSISGPPVVCTSGNFSFLGSPAGTTVTWSTDPATMATVSSGQGTTSATIVKSYGGTALLKVDYQNACFKGTATKSVRFGGYNSSEYTFTGPSFPCRNSYVTFNATVLEGAISYNWFYPTTPPNSFTYISGQGTSTLTLRTPASGNGVIGLRVANICDAGGAPFIKFVNINTNCGQAYRISPNPSNSLATVEAIIVKAGGIIEASNSPLIKRVRIREKTGRLLQDRSFAGGVSKAIMSLYGLKHDIYIIQVYDGKSWSNMELIVK